MTTQHAFRTRHRAGWTTALVSSLLFVLLAAVSTASAQSADVPEANPPAAVSFNGWSPPDVDAAVPPVRPDVPCPLQEVLNGAGARLQELVQNLQQFAAKEQIEHVQMDKGGHAKRPESATFTYVVEIHTSAKEGTRIQEYRNGSDSRFFQGGLATAGTAAHALILHPDIIGDYTVTCEGLGMLEGKPAWQVHFVQRPDRPARFRTYQTQHGAYSVALRGRAWIAPDNFQILRMESDLVSPIPELRLFEDHVVVDYGPVGFPKHNVQLWLPRTADLYMDLLGKRFHRRHTFSDFELFWVDVSHKETAKEP